jgi:hypothetical protein
MMARRLALTPLALVPAFLSLAAFAASASAAPRNDDFRDALRVRVGQPVNGTVSGATSQRGEPRHANSLAKHSVWYRIAATRRVAIALGTCNSNFDTVIAVYTGRRVGSLRLVDFNNDGCDSGGSRVTFTARPGRVYRIAVAGFTPRGRFRMTVRSISTPPNDDFVDAAPIRLGETIAATSRNATRELREPAHQYNHAHTVWFKLSVVAPTGVHVSNCSAGGDTHVTVYTGSRVSALTLVSESDGDCDATFAGQPGVAYRIVVEAAGSGGGVRLSARAV